MSVTDGPEFSSQELRTTYRHRPAVAAVVALATGICLDRFIGIPMWGWLSFMLASLSGAIWICLYRFRPSRSRIASSFVLLLLIAVGGARQHLFWNMRPVNDISTFDSYAPLPARLIGIVATPIEILEARFGPRIPPWMEIDRSTCTLLCESLEEDDTWHPVSGLVRLDVSGHLVHVRVGDRVEILGHLSQPRPPDNPGGIDYRDFLLRQGISSILRVEHPVAVKKLNEVKSLRWALARWRESIRNQCMQIFFKQLNAEQCGLSASLLIGDRTMLTDELQNQFAQTGTMHLLAISGLHVGILIGLVLALCRLANFNSRAIAATLLLTVVAYIFITDFRPPVLRAGLLTTIAVIGTLRGDRIDRMNALAMSALILLLWHPSDLFDIGAQLSFLAVGAILWSTSWNRRMKQQDQKLIDLLKEVSPWRQRLQPVGQYLLDVYKVTTAVTLATLPLTLAIFHLIAPVGILLNILLIPYIAVVLGLGYLLMFGGLLLPVSAGLLAIPFRWSLTLLQRSVEWGQTAPWGHLYIPSSPLWWLIIFYLLMAVAWQMVGTERSARWGFKAILCWCVLGLIVPCLPSRSDSLRCTFLSVGHGLASVIEFPSGETMLYDAGTIGDGERAARAVAQMLWSRNIQQLDAVIVSHADHDHFSGLFGLLEQVPVQTLLISSSFLDFEQQGVADLCDLASSKGTIIQLLQADDQLKLRKDIHQSVHLHALYPPQELSERSDNSSSTVISIEYANRRLLLTGDLEKEGLADILALPAHRADILLSPHHGGKVANVHKLYDWAQPQYAVVSSGDQLLPHLANVPASCTLLNTATSGAIAFEIRPDGEIRIEEFRKN